MLPNSFYSSSELGLCFPPFWGPKSQPVCYCDLTTNACFFNLLDFLCLFFDTFASSVGEKIWSLGCLFYIRLYLFVVVFLNWGITSDGPCFIIGFYEVFKKKSFKQRLCLACNTLCALCSPSDKYTHQYISRGVIATFAEKLDFRGYEKQVIFQTSVVIDLKW